MNRNLYAFEMMLRDHRIEHLYITECQDTYIYGNMQTSATHLVSGVKFHLPPILINCPIRYASCSV